ncbi:MAG: zf-HC2 domain-containing protein [Acidobacteria bacterium]|nr:zf-HC2 domain-containing protein [Acidobacteriota bacterium]
MTDCNWTEKVSLLIDGELAAAEARAVEQHLGDCFACRLAREDFLLLRHQLGSYRADVNLIAQRRALDHILDSAAAALPSAKAGGWRERAPGLFTLPRLGPALVAASALVLVGLVVGLLLLRDATTGEIAGGARPRVVSPTPAARPKDSAPAPTPDGAEVAKIKPRGASGIGGAKAQTENAGGVGLAKGGVKPKGSNSTNIDRSRPGGQGGAAQVASAAGESDDLPLIIPQRIPAADSGPSDAAEVASFAPDPRPEANPTSLSASRHAEQAQQLLRAFRNADAGAGSDLAYERGRSQELLYQNIVLRREAASRGNVAVESVLGSLEPILVDIANLSDKPAREDVRTISERMKKKDIVAQLQIAARDDD